MLCKRCGNACVKCMCLRSSTQHIRRALSEVDVDDKVLMVEDVLKVCCESERCKSPLLD